MVYVTQNGLLGLVDPAQKSTQETALQTSQPLPRN